MSSRRKRFALVCLLYTEIHDGFGQAKGIRRQDRIKVLDMVAFSIAAGYCFETSTLQLFNGSLREHVMQGKVARVVSGRDLALLIAQRLNDPNFNVEMELRRIFV